jgi:enediyne biosynthesis protein E4
MTRMRWIVLTLAALTLGGIGLAWQFFGGASAPSEPHDPPWFEDVTDRVGLNFVHDPGPLDIYFMPQQVGSGAALFDFDKDGLLDILLLQNAGPQSMSTNRLFRQQKDGTFQDVSAGSGLDINGYNMGVAIGDFNNDGWPDVLITQYNGVKLFLNRGNGTFLDVTDAAGLSNPSWGTSAAFLDYDRDGWLDIVIVNYVNYDPTLACKTPGGAPDFCAPKLFKGRVSRLFHNLGAKGAASAAGVAFEDVTQSSGLGSILGPGLGVLCADFDGDGWPDILVANDGQPNHLWMNQKNGKFTEEAVRRGIAVNEGGAAQANMGIAYGDVNGDGLMDVFVTHLADETHTLWLQGPRGLFLDRTSSSGILRTRWRGTAFGTVFGDFDNDGHLDLALVNGAVTAAAAPTDNTLGPFWGRYGQRNQLLANDGHGRFRDVSPYNAPFCGKNNVARGLACGDIDRDGGLDLLVTTIGDRARLFRNVAPRGHWLSVRAVDPALGRDALGTSVEVWSGKRRWIRWMHPAESFLCSSEPRAHFGLGAVSTVDRIEITWPDGSREAFPGRNVDQRVEVHKGQGKRIGDPG